MPMYRTHSQPVIDIKESVSKHLAAKMENGEEITALLCKIIQLDTLLQAFPYNGTYRTELNQALEELNPHLSSKTT
ncbi:hypothetical protein BEP19_15285 [Ammoniphilus oxalaticus]|uniref:Uncharacterized protein n=1 Tax=Ammoniphilus oxalaticus TaxID=66863 RepID=A0A419SD84_9BACL|nr:hypothetical protein [Ammoniphilus oxalaticus]RKD21041.1 hypothetical protein BEP19_15285 [Ammoniphilus oxalaticus]